jgi:hypothetical protein
MKVQKNTTKDYFSHMNTLFYKNKYTENQMFTDCSWCWLKSKKKTNSKVGFMLW